VNPNKPDVDIGCDKCIKAHTWTGYRLTTEVERYSKKT